VVEEHLPLGIGVVGHCRPSEPGDERENGVCIPGFGSSYVRHGARRYRSARFDQGIER
jgi:hypothetical protein